MSRMDVTDAQDNASAGRWRWIAFDVREGGQRAVVAASSLAYSHAKSRTSNPSQTLNPLNPLSAASILDRIQRSLAGEGEDHAGVEDAGRVEGVLDRAEGGDGLRAPDDVDERRAEAAVAVLAGHRAAEGRD